MLLGCTWMLHVPEYSLDTRNCVSNPVLKVVSEVSKLFPVQHPTIVMFILDQISIPVSLLKSLSSRVPMSVKLTSFQGKWIVPDLFESPVSTEV